MIAFLIFTLFCSYPAFSGGKQEPKTPSPPLPAISPVEAYYAGKIEQSAEVFGSNRATLEEKAQMVVIHWELGEMDKAAELLEELLKEQSLTPAVRGELQTQLFYTYALLGSYSKAAALRTTVERFVSNQDARIRAEFLFYSAFIYQEMGNLDRAIDLYKKSLELNKWRPIAWYRLGLLLREKDPKEAETCLRTCWEQDSSFTAALLPLARLLMDKKDWRRAASYLYTATTRLPNNREVSAAVTETRRHAYIGPGDGTYLIRRQITANPPKVQPAPPSTREGSLRVGLIEKRNLVSVKAGGAYTIHTVGTNQRLHAGWGKEQFWVETAANNTITIQDKDKKVLARSTVPVVYKLDSNEDSSIVAGVVNGAPGTNRTYRGWLEFRPGPGGMTVVNVLPMEDYLYGVIPAEMPSSWPVEALKAQAIAARSYAVAYRGNFADRGFDIHGTPHSQAYHGVGAETKRTTDAVAHTRGMVLMGGAKPLRAYYSANHGGYSEDSLTLWGYDAFMQPVPDIQLPLRTEPLPLDELYRWIRDTPATYSNVPRFSYISAYRWEKWVSPAEIRRRIISDARVTEDPGEITQIITRGRGISGRITELEVKGSNGSAMVKGDAVWFTMGGLRSSLFTIRHKLDRRGNLEYFVFQGAGFGHGIGMDQHGAAGMASTGLSAQDILRHYYPRSVLGRL